MSKRRIPKPDINKDSHISKPTLVNTCESNVVFSFAVLEWTEYFNLESTCRNWSWDMLNMLKDISKISKAALMRGEYKTYRVHNHEKAIVPCPLPEGVALKDLYQLRISTAKGGIHGVFSENTFYVIWMDPLHNMYPNENYGGLRKIKPPTNCCADREERVLKLQEENQKLKEEIEILEQACNGCEGNIHKN